MTTAEWLGRDGWWLLSLGGGGGLLVALAAPRRRHPALRIVGSTLGSIAVSSLIGLLALFVLGLPWLVLLYPIVFALSVLVWRTTEGRRLLGILLVAAVNWWLILWLGFLIVTGGGGGHAAT